MQLLRPDPTFYASPKDAIEAPPETLALSRCSARVTRRRLGASTCRMRVEFDPAYRVHQIRLQGDDASSDSYCFS